MAAHTFTWRADAFRLAGNALLVVPRARPRGGREPDAVPVPEAQRLLSERFAASSELRAQLMRWYARERGSESCLVATTARERVALRWALEAIEQGRVAVLWLRVPPVAGPLELPVRAPPRERQPLVADKLHALEFELLDQDGEPFAGVAWIVVGPDGEVRRGRLSAQGYAYLPDVPAGQYKLQFPAPEDDEPPDEAEVLDIELVSTEGVPLGGFEYIATFSDGSRWQGTLDDNGRAHLSPVPPGDFEVVFPALEAELEEDDGGEANDAEDDRTEPEDGGEALVIDDSTDPTPEVAIHDHHDAGDGDQEQALVGAKAACRPPSGP